MSKLNSERTICFKMFPNHVCQNQQLPTTALDFTLVLFPAIWLNKWSDLVSKCRQKFSCSGKHWINAGIMFPWCNMVKPLNNGKCVVWMQTNLGRYHDLIQKIKLVDGFRWANFRKNNVFHNSWQIKIHGVLTYNYYLEFSRVDHMDHISY